MTEPTSLKRQLEIARFERALAVCESLAEHRALLTTMELSRLNQIVTGLTEMDPWREDTVTLMLPSGKSETISLVADPKVTARDKLHRATELAENGSVIDAAVDIYVGLVRAHVFAEANRRTAVLAAHYFLRRYGASISGLALHEMGLGDVRDDKQVEALRQMIQQLARFTAQTQSNSGNNSGDKK